MRIERAVLREIELELRQQFESSAGVVSSRRILLLSVQGGGLEGWGECVAGAAPSYTYETTETAWHVLTGHLLPLVVGQQLSDPGDALRSASWIRGHPMAKAAVEMAAWDLAARAEDVSLARMLGGVRDAVPAGVSLGLKATDEELCDEIEACLHDGYDRVKLKMKPGRDVEMLRRVRDRFPDVRLWADANAAYSLDDVGHLRELDAVGLELLEQPLATDDLTQHARLQSELVTPICLDESIGSAHDAVLAASLGSCRVVNVKPGRVGGHAESRRLHDAVPAEVALWCGGMLESGVGRAHNVALAALPGFTLPGDLSPSGRHLQRDIVDPALAVRDGEVTVPRGPGIGVAVDVDLVASLTRREAVFG